MCDAGQPGAIACKTSLTNNTCAVTGPSSFNCTCDGTAYKGTGTQACSACPAFADTYDTVLAAAAATPALSTLTSAITVSSYASLLNDTTTVITVFAPTNASFAAYLTDAGITEADFLANSTLVDSVVGYHAVPGIILPSCKIDGTLVLTTVASANVTVFGNATGVFVQGALNTVRVVSADIKAGSGVVHVVDGVLRNA